MRSCRNHTLHATTLLESEGFWIPQLGQQEAALVEWAAARVVEGKPADRLEELIWTAVFQLWGELPETDPMSDLVLVAAVA